MIPEKRYKSQMPKKKVSLVTQIKKEATHLLNPNLASLMYYEIKSSLENYSAIDICFVCDITGSMEKYIQKIKDSL